LLLGEEAILPYFGFTFANFGLDKFGVSALHELVAKLGDPQQAVKDLYYNLRKKRNNFLNAHSKRNLDDRRVFLSDLDEVFSIVKSKLKKGLFHLCL
jgi:hypothetical protein